MTGIISKRRMERMEILTPLEAAERLRVSDQTILREIYAKRLKAFRVGRQWRIYSESIEAFERRAAFGVIARGTK